MDDYIRTPNDPTPSGDLKDDGDYNENKEPSSTSSKVISFSMSLPLVFSSQHDTTTTSVARSSKPTSRPTSPDYMKVVSSFSLSQSTPTFQRESMSNQGGRGVCVGVCVCG